MDGLLHGSGIHSSMAGLQRQHASFIKRRHSIIKYNCSALGVTSNQVSSDSDAGHSHAFMQTLQSNGAATISEDKEQQRRQKISLANKGNVPWNKGRKHSPETIAKIKARTAEAMQRPEVVAKVQAAAAANVGKTHSSETKAKIGAAAKSRHIKTKEQGRDPTPEEVEAMKLKRCSTAKAMWDDPEYREKTLAGIRKAAEERKARRQAERLASGAEPPKKMTPEERREKLREAGRKAWQNPEFRDRMRKQVTELLHKRHQEMTEEEKAAWRAGQRERARRLWNDPEYREKTLAAIQSRHAQMNADGNPRPSRPRTAPSKPKVPTKKEQAAGVDRLRALWQGRLALLAKTIRTIHILEQRVTDLTQLERALANDPQRHAEAVQGIAQATQCLELASQKVKELSSSVPAFVKYDKLGNMVSFDEEAASQHHASQQAAAVQAASAQGTTTQHPTDSSGSASSSAAPDAHLSPSSVLPTTAPDSHDNASISPTFTPKPQQMNGATLNTSQQPTNNLSVSRPSPTRLPWQSGAASSLRNSMSNGASNAALQDRVNWPHLQNGVHHSSGADLQNGVHYQSGVNHPNSVSYQGGVDLRNGVNHLSDANLQNGTHEDDANLENGVSYGNGGNLQNGMHQSDGVNCQNGRRDVSVTNGVHGDGFANGIKNKLSADELFDESLKNGVHDGSASSSQQNVAPSNGLQNGTLSNGMQNGVHNSSLKDGLNP